MKKIIILLLIFLILNLGSLVIGSVLMQNGPLTDWYLELNKAPWTPPGWLFGVAWTTIMICFSFYMAFLYIRKGTLKLMVLFSIQMLLNISWNYIFFNKHLIGLGLLTILMLTLLIFYILIAFRKELKIKSLLLLPYFLWLCVASSLNLYIYFYN